MMRFVWMREEHVGLEFGLMLAAALDAIHAGELDAVIAAQQQHLPFFGQPRWLRMSDSCLEQTKSAETVHP